MKHQRGFTLIELMIVVLVIAVLAGIAYPMYTEQVRKGRRAEAKQVLADFALRQEKWRSNNATYGSLTNILGVATTTYTLPSGYYTVGAVTFAPAGGDCPGSNPAVAVGSANSYVITATAAGAQLADAKCATIVLSNYCGTVSKTATGTAPTTCW